MTKTNLDPLDHPKDPEDPVLDLPILTLDPEDQPNGIHPQRATGHSALWVQNCHVLDRTPPGISNLCLAITILSKLSVRLILVKQEKDEEPQVKMGVMALKK